MTDHPIAVPQDNRESQEGTLVVIEINSSVRSDGQIQHQVSQLLASGLLSKDTTLLAQLLRNVANQWDSVNTLTYDQAIARNQLAQEWRNASPVTPAEVDEFYRTSQFNANDLHAWHATKGRQEWTDSIVSIAKRIEAKVAIDIGCGAGYELRALKEAGIPELYGVELNQSLRGRITNEDHITCYPDVQDAPIEKADLLICLDVLEHVVDPETFIGSIAQRAHPSCVLIESTATFDHSTPLHLEANYGWTPDACLERNGWKLLNSHRVHVWQRVTT